MIERTAKLARCRDVTDLDAPGRARTRGPRRYCSIGGSSSSSSTANTTTQNYDLRVAGGNNSTNVSASNSTVTLTDRGAVASAFGFSRDAFNSAVGGFAKSVEQIQEAYSTAKAGEQKVLVAGGLIIMGIVAVAAVKGAK